MTTELYPREINAPLSRIVDRLREIQPKYEFAVSKLRKDLGKHVRGCGAGAVFLGKLIQQETPTLSLRATLEITVEKDDGIRVVFGLQREFGKWIDHSWVETIEGGQTLIVSPESKLSAPDVSFRATVVNTSSLQGAYSLIGLRRLRPDDIGTLIGSESLAAAKEIIEDVNKGETPQMYKEWLETLKASVEVK